MLTQMEEHVLSIKRNLYINSGCQLEVQTVCVFFPLWLGPCIWILLSSCWVHCNILSCLDTAVIKLGAVLHSIMSGYCCHQDGCSATFCHVWILLSSRWVQCYILSCLDTAVIRLGAVLHSVMSRYCCHQAGCSATFCHV